MNHRMLNIGCGKRLHPGWVNVDLVASSPSVQVVDIRKGLPFPDASFDVVYHSHLLEHLTPEGAAGFLRECARVLSPDGLVRVVVPDLEAIATRYIETIREVDEGGAEDGHTWMTLELLDQMTRSRPGGRIAELAKTAGPEMRRIAQERWGKEALQLWDDKKNQGIASHSERHEQVFKKIPGALKRRFLKLVLGKACPAYETGLFRLSGEVHQWMYDRVSLSSLLKASGFTQIVRRDAFESFVPDWGGFHLDTEPDGTVCKPDSLFMEGRMVERTPVK